MRRIFITGARGYLGGRLVVDYARAKRFDIVGVTRGAAPPPVGWPSVCALARTDLLHDSEDHIAEVLKGCDAIVHLAAPNEMVALQRPAEALVDTAVGTLRLIEAAKRAECRRFVFLSTIHVYGSPLRGRITEIDPLRPLHPYAIVHHSAEDFVLAAHARGDIEAAVVRLSNGIGAPAWPTIDRWTLIGNDLCRQAVRDGTVVLRSSGLQWRDFIVLSDFADAIARLIEAPAGMLGDGVFNLGGRMPLRMIDVAKRVAARATVLLGRDIQVVTAAAKPGEAWDSIDYVIERMATLGFSPSPVSALDRELDATLALCAADRSA